MVCGKTDISLLSAYMAITRLGNGPPNAVAQEGPKIVTTKQQMYTLNFESNLGERATDVSHVAHRGLVDVDGGDGDLQTGPQPQQEPAHIELPGLTGCHHHRPPDEQAHDGEGQQGGLPSHSIHQEDCTQGTKHCSQGQQAAHP